MGIMIFHRARKLQREGKLEEAIPAYQSVIAQNPAFYLAYQNLGESLEGLGRWEEAIIHYRQAIKLNSNSALSHYQLGRALVKSGCLNQGIEVLNAGLKLKPGYHKYYEQLRNAWFQKGEWEKAIANHKKAIEINHSDALQIFDFIDYKSQLNQDKWVVMMTQGKQQGIFLEIGSTDGVDLNNTFCLEKVFSWSGICVEPNPDFFKKLCANRTATTFPYCFYKESGQIVEFIPDSVFGTISEFSSTDFHASRREKFVSESGTIKVITARPEDILNLYDFPEIFDFLSLDVEGAELDVLECFNLSKWRPALACIEHNYVADKRLAIFELLSSYGYQRIECQWDDWYYNLDILKVLNPEIPISHYQRVLQYFCNYPIIARTSDRG
jgi:FkbM family methyltransferase